MHTKESHHISREVISLSIDFSQILMCLGKKNTTKSESLGTLGLYREMNSECSDWLSRFLRGALRARSGVEAERGSCTANLLTPAADLSEILGSSLRQSAADLVRLEACGESV